MKHQNVKVSLDCIEAYKVIARARRAGARPNYSRIWQPSGWRRCSRRRGVVAITGQSRQMVEHYAKQVNQKKLAAKAVLKWERWN
jgi:hypothetical protein